MQSFLNTIKRRRLLEKACFVSSVAMICFVTYCMTSAHYLMPYVFPPIAVGSMLIELFCYNGMIGLMEICHVGNALFVLFLWKFPQNEAMFCVVFVLTNGPVGWALYVFRNSLVLHDFSKMRAIYIHITPWLLSVLIRWYPGETSRLWHQDFMPQFMDISFIWHFAIPLAITEIQSILWDRLNELLKPALTYKTVYEYLTSTPGSYWNIICNVFGPKYQYAMYRFCRVLSLVFYCCISAVVYSSFPVHCILTALASLCVVYNGACFYLEVFSVRDQPQFLRSISHLTDHTHS